MIQAQNKDKFLNVRISQQCFNLPSRFMRVGVGAASVNGFKERLNSNMFGVFEGFLPWAGVFG